MSSDAVTADGRSLVLADGAEMPLLGLGVWQIPDGPECVNAVRWALELGYRHIDTAQAYGNEESVGRALRESGVPREELFITTKFFPGHTNPVVEAEHSLRRLGLDHVDLYIVHWPKGGPMWAWPGIQRAQQLGHARSIGVSNFDVRELRRVLDAGGAKPVIDQVQFSPFEYRRELLEVCEEGAVALGGYSSLGTGHHIGDTRVAQVAERVGRTPAQVLLRWCVQKGVPVIPKSTHRERIEENGQIFDFQLAYEDIAALDALDETGGTGEAQERKWW
jgi:diketogulonate reductase-like aldo/keto reductase